MCGILGIVARSPVNQLLYDGLLLLQHRGQDAAGIVTGEHNRLHMHKASVKLRLDPQTIFTAVANVHRRVRGAYAVVAMIAGYGVLAFRDPYGIRPAVIGYNETDARTEYMVASESGAGDAPGFRVLRD